eukprot:5656480-Prymnesium_polylepis.2
MHYGATCDSCCRYEYWSCCCGHANPRYRKEAANKARGLLYAHVAPVFKHRKDDNGLEAWNGLYNISSVTGPSGALQQTLGVHSEAVIPDPVGFNQQKRGESQVPYAFFVTASKETGQTSYDPKLIINFELPETSNWKSNVIRHWPVLIGIAASTAAPGYFKPVRYANVEYLDGAIAANNPAWIATCTS